MHRTVKTRTNSLYFKGIKNAGLASSLCCCWCPWALHLLCHPTCAAAPNNLQDRTLPIRSHTALAMCKLPFVSKEKSCGQPFKTLKICSDMSSSSFSLQGLQIGPCLLVWTSIFSTIIDIFKGKERNHIKGSLGSFVCRKLFSFWHFPPACPC